MSGWVQAGEFRATPVAAPDVSLSAKSVYLDAPAPADDPLMALLVKAGVGNSLKSAGISAGGRIEGSWTYSASNPPGNVIGGRVFDFENQDPTLNQIGIYLNKDVDVSKFDVGGRMEWIWGADSRLIHSLGLFDYYGGTPDNQWDLNQLYIDVSFGGGWKVRAGKFVALAGYEVIDPTQNMFYSHSFSFGYGIPFTHTGALVSQKVNDQITWQLGFSRGWDTSLEDSNGTIDFLGAIEIKPTANERWFINFTTGADQAGDNDNWRTLINVIYENQITKEMKIGVDGVFGYEANSAGSAEGSDAMWFGVAGYAKYQLNDNVILQGRLEYFNDQDGARLTGGVGGTSLYEATVGLQIIPLPNNQYTKNLTIRPEVRFDYSQKPFFDGGSDYYQVTAAIDAVYKF
jgi:hypothetical protein